MPKRLRFFLEPTVVSLRYVRIARRKLGVCQYLRTALHDEVQQLSEMLKGSFPEWLTYHGNHAAASTRRPFGGVPALRDSCSEPLKD